MIANGVAFSNKWADWRELVRIRPVHDYVAEFMELSKPVGYEPNDDARQEYDKALQLAVESTKEIKDFYQRYPTHWSDQERTQVEAWLVSNAEALKFFEKGSRKPCYWPEYKPERKQSVVLSSADGKGMMCLSIALATRALVSAAQDRLGEAMDDIATCYRVGRHLLQCRDTMSQVMGMSVYGLASQTTRMILSHEDVSPELMTALQERLEKLAAEQPIRFDFLAEQLFPLDTIQSLFTDDGHGGGHIPRCFFTSPESQRDGLEYLLSDMAEATDADIGEWRKLDRHSTTDDVRQYYRALEEATSLAPWDYEKNTADVKNAVEQIRKNSFIRLLCSVNPMLRHLSAKARADLDSVIAILAMLRYKADRHKFPENVELLAGEGYLKTIARDPFSSGALIYKRTTDNFLLYSWGVDFDDDGGMPSTWGEGEQGGDQVLWPVSDAE